MTATGTKGATARLYIVTQLYRHVWRSERKDENGITRETSGAGLRTQCGRK